MDSIPTPEDFERAVAALYDCDGWVVDSDVTIAGCQVDLVARKPVAGIQHSVAVECTLERVTARKFAADFVHLMTIRTPLYTSEPFLTTSFEYVQHCLFACSVCFFTTPRNVRFTSLPKLPAFKG